MNIEGVIDCCEVLAWKCLLLYPLLPVFCMLNYMKKREVDAKLSLLVNVIRVPKGQITLKPPLYGKTSHQLK